MASTAELCAIISTLGGDPETLPDRLEKTLTDEIIRILGSGSSLHLSADKISYGVNSNVKAALDAKPTAAEVVTAFQAMSAEQIAAVKTVLSIE